MTMIGMATAAPERGPIEQEAIDRGEAPHWVAVARRLDGLRAAFGDLKAELAAATPPRLHVVVAGHTARPD